MLYERQKHDGTLPIIGVNTFLAEHEDDKSRAHVALIRSSEDEKQAQVTAVKAFQARNAERAPDALHALQRVATTGGNVFAELINTVRWCSLGQISRALYDVGGQYRRSV
jgi:methylmalonyl-CoA mutase